jgi:3'-phosphoadenosine 5'-phosphosulfate sulfotransferase (PAPS reductase)/FAD synthetase
MAEQWGIPAFNSRWCCRELKIKPLATFLRGIQETKIVFDGIRAAESAIRAKYTPFWFHPGFGCLSISPIFRWSDAEVGAYIADNKLPQGDHLTLGTSSECWCGAYKTRSDFEALCRIDPELYGKLADVEANNRNGFTFVYEGGERVSLMDIRRQLEAG